MTTKADLHNRFLYHKPDERAQEAHGNIRVAFIDFAERLERLIPIESREKSLFLTKLEESGFWAHAAIARHDHKGTRR